jgi:hypothetical protein
MGDKPSVPKYDVDAAHAEQEYIRDKTKQDLYLNYNSGLGGYTYDPETNQINVNYNTADKNRLLNITGAVNNLDMNPDEATVNYYNRAIASIQPELDKYRAQTSANLVNKGIPIGSQAYNEVMRQQDNDIANTLADLYTASRSQALADTGAQIGNIGALQSQMYSPEYVAGIGSTGLKDTYNDQFQNQMDIYNAKMASYNSKIGAINKLGGTVGGAIGSIWGPIGGMIGSTIGSGVTSAATSLAS